MKKYCNGKKLLVLIGLLIMSLMMFAGCGQSEETSDAADMVLESTYIYTCADEEPVSGGIAVKDGTILAVGSLEDMEQYIGDNTEVIDYGDQMIMPGFVDAHTHSMLSESVLGVDVTMIEDQAQATEAVKKFIEENPDEEYIIGAGWYAAAWGGDDPDKKYLDEATTDLPVVLYDYDHHCTWVNSKALEMAGVDAEYAKKYNEEHGQEYIVVDENGEPTGYLRDLDASAAVEGLIPEFTTEDLEYCINVWSEYGVTTINEMTWYMAEDPYYDMIEELEDNDRLNIRHMLTVDSSETDENIEALKERFDSDVAKMTSIKTFMDGAGSTYTASMLKNYKDSDTNGGEPYKTAEEVSAIVQKAADHDLVTHFHACGDKAVRTVFDGYDMAVAAGVELNPGFSIEHCDTVHPDDINRPAELGISCNVTPDFMAPTETWDTNPYVQVYDDDVCKELWNYGSLYKSGANVAFCTDSYFSSYSPFVQIYRATQRVTNDGKPVGGYLPEEKFTVEEAIECYTVNSARSCGMLDKVGTLEAGKYADIIVLDTNILTCTPEELFNTTVDVTYMNGKEVFRAAK